MAEEGSKKMNNIELEKDDFYYSEEGYIVFTEKYLLKREYCCQNGCRHCPYGFKKPKSIRNKFDTL